MSKRQILGFTGLLFIALFSSIFVSAQTTYYSRNTGAWTSTNTWSTTSHTAGGPAGPPVAGDIVLIGGSDVVTVINAVAAVAAAQVTVSDDGTTCSLVVGDNTNTNNATLNVTSSITINTGGTITVGGLNSTAGRTGNLLGGAALTLNGSGALIIGNTSDEISTVNVSTITQNGTSTITVGANQNASHTLTASGAVSIGATAIFRSGGNNGGTHTVNFQSTLANNGTITLDDDDAVLDNDAVTLTVASTTNNTGTITFGSDVGVKTFAGALTNSGTFDATGTATTGNLVFRSGVSSTGGTFTAGGATFNDVVSNAQTIGGTAAMSFANTVTLSDAGGASLVVTNDNTNTVTLSNINAGTLTGTAGVTWRQGAGSTLSYAGSTVSNNITLDASTNANTVNYSGGGQTVVDVGYRNLVTSGSGTKTWTQTAIRSVNGTLTVGNGTTLSIGGAFDFSVTGTTTIGNGALSTFNITSTGTKTFTGAVTVNANAVWNLTGNPATSFAAGIAMNGTTFNNGTGAAGFSATQSLTGASNMTFGGTVTPAGGTTLTNSNTGTLTISNTGSIVLTGNFTQGLNANLSLAAAAPFSGAGTFDAATNTNTVTYTGANPPIKPTTYSNLVFSGTGSATIGGATTVNGTMTVTSAVTNNNTLTVTTALSGGSTLIQGTGSTLNIGGTSGITTLDASSNANTVNYTGAAQTVKAVAYRTLGLSGSGAKTMTGVTTINGDFTLGGTASATAAAGLTVSGNVTLGSGTTFTAGAFTHNITGNWLNNGTTFDNSGSTINLNGAAQSIGGSSSTTFNNLTLGGSNTKTFSVATFSSGDLSILSGVVANLGSFTSHTAYTLTLNGAAQASGVWGNTISGAPNTNNTFFAATVGTLTVAYKTPVVFYTRATGNWNAPATWSTITYAGAAATSFPVAGDIVNIGGGNFTVTVNVNSACASISYLGSDNFNTSVSLNSGITLDVSGEIDIPTAGLACCFTSYSNTLVVGAGILNAGSIFFSDGGLGTHSLTISTGTATVNGDVTAEVNILQTSITISGAGTLNIGEDFPNSSNVVFTAAATSTVNYNGAAQTVSDFTYGNLTISGSDTKTMMAATDINGTLTIEFGVTLDAGALSHTVGGNWVNNGTFTHSGSTITFDGAAQSIGGTSSTAFNNLALNGTGTKTFGRVSSSAGYFAVGSGAMATLGGFNHTATTISLGGTGEAAGTYGGTGSGAANIRPTYFTAGAGIVTTTVGGPNIYYSRLTGNWNNVNTWSQVGYGGAAATSFPTAGSVVNIGGGYTVTVNVNSACANLNYQGNTGNENSVTINTGISLTVSGDINLANGTLNGSFPFLHNNGLTVGGGVLSAGSINFIDGGGFGTHELTISTGTATVTGNVTGGMGILLTSIDITSTGTLNLGGTFLTPNDTDFGAGTGTVNYNGAAAQTIQNFTYYNLSTSGSGTKTFADDSDIDGTVTIGAGTTLVASISHTVGGNWVNNGTFTNSTGTITLDGTAQSIGGSVTTTFNNLTLGGSGTKTFAVQTNINATIAINSGVVANLGAGFVHPARTLALNNQGQIPGTWGGTGSGATNINTTYFAANTGILNVTNRIYFSRVNNGNWDATTSWSTVSYTSGVATNAGTYPQAGDIASIGGDFNINVNIANAACAFVTFQGASATTNTLTINTGNTLDVSGSITIPRANNGESNTMAVGAGTLNAGSLIFSSGGPAGTRHRLTISTGTVTISGDVTESSSTGSALITFTGAGQLFLGGEFLNSDNGTLTQSTGTVTYNGSGAQTIGDFTYNNLTLNNTGTLTLYDDATVTNTLTMTSGIVDLDGNTLTLGASGAASTLARTASTTTNWMYGGTFSRFWPASTPVTSGSGNYYGLFPVGASAASSYRPVEINSTSSPTGTGSFSVSHTSANSVTSLSPVYNDGGTNIVRKHNAQFEMSTTATGGTYNIGVTMTGLPATGLLSDLRLAKHNTANTVTAVGTHAAATGTVSNPTVNRTGVALALIPGDYRITTTNLLVTPLPIELSLFKGEVVNNMVKLTWETSSELNNDFFTVERSSSGEIFSAIGEVSGNGTTNQHHVYTLNDVDPFTGTSYYRLKQTDFDGTFTYSKIIPVTYEGSFFPVMHLYPNPTVDNKINIQIKGMKNAKVIPIRVYDNLGVEWIRKDIVVDENTGMASDVLHFEKSLPRGVYIVKAGPSQIMAVRFVVYEK